MGDGLIGNVWVNRIGLGWVGLQLDSEICVIVITCGCVNPIDTKGIYKYPLTL